MFLASSLAIDQAGREGGRQTGFGDFLKIKY